jgi:hypothetical protein
VAAGGALRFQVREPRGQVVDDPRLGVERALLPPQLVQQWAGEAAPGCAGAVLDWLPLRNGAFAARRCFSGG